MVRAMEANVQTGGSTYLYVGQSTGTVFGLWRRKPPRGTGEIGFNGAPEESAHATALAGIVVPESDGGRY